MGVMTILATELNFIGKLIYNVLYGWVAGWGISSSALIGAFGVTVILFTIILQIITSPLDLWQKQVTRKNAKIMRIMKPEQEKLKKQYAGDQNQLMLKQRELNKKYKYSPLKACLPTIVTLVIFIFVFQGFRSAVSYHNSAVYDDVQANYNTTYNATYKDEYDRLIATSDGTSEGAKQADLTAKATATALAEKAALEAYKIEPFLATKNIFMADNWSEPIPSVAVYAGNSIGGLGISGVDSVEYNKVMKSVRAEYNLNDAGKKSWNGYLILPILALILNILSTKLIKPAEQPQIAGQTEAQKKSQDATAKMMQWTMPIMMFVFAILYSAAFTLYMLLRSFMTLLFNLTYNIITKKIDAKEEDERLSKSIKNR